MAEKEVLLKRIPKKVGKKVFKYPNKFRIYHSFINSFREPEFKTYKYLKYLNG